MPPKHYPAPEQDRIFLTMRALRRGGSFVDGQLAGRAHEAMTRRRAPGENKQREDIRGRIEQIIAFGDADRLERWPERGSATEQERYPDAGERVPPREDDKRHCHQPLTTREPLVPVPGIIKRQKRAADPGEKSA